MNELNQLYARNESFAADYQNKLSILPHFKTIIVACADGRVDPAQTLGLALGEAIVFRNMGGRVTDDLMMDLGILYRMAQKLAGVRFAGVELALVQHTDCGCERLAQPQFAATLSTVMDVELACIHERGFADHEARLHEDVRRLQETAVIPNQLIVSGHIYNVETGRLEQIIAPKPLSEQAAIMAR